MPSSDLLHQTNAYLLDAWQRSILFANVLRQRGDNFLEHAEAGKPPVLVFEHELVLDARDFEMPCNYALLRIIPGADCPTNPDARPFVVIDPRAGHGPGIAGSKVDSSIGVALAAGHPCYFVTFGPEPCPDQTIECVLRAEIKFLEKVNELHASCGEKPFVIGNCQGGWALMLLACTEPDLVGPIMLAGAPLAYWSGKSGQNPMRYSGGMLGGSWLSSLASDLGNGHFDGAYLVENFENLNPANTHWGKLYNLYSNVDTEEQRYLDFERWWGGHFLMNRAEIDWIVQNLFIGNKLVKGQIPDPVHGGVFDLHNIRSPIIIFASHGDNITPPPQALNWICDLYSDDAEIRLREQVIVYCLHEKIGHLGIFVSSGVALREHSKLVGALELIELLPPGLYEAQIKDLCPDAPFQELIKGRHVISFEPRTLDDIRALDDGRADEAAFEVVQAISERNQQNYNNFVSPFLQAISSEPMAKMVRHLHSSRVDRYSWSSFNPFTFGLSDWAEKIKNQRQPLAPNNSWQAMEQSMSDYITNSWDSWRIVRDQASEIQFKSLYASPYLRHWMGLPPADPSGARAIPHDKALQQEIQELRTQLALATMHQGGVAEAILRGLIYLNGPATFIDERAFHLLERILKAQKDFELPNMVQIREMVRHQTLVMQLDAEAAINALPELVPDENLRFKIWQILCEVMQLKKAINMDSDVAKRYHYLTQILAPQVRQDAVDQADDCLPCNLSSGDPLQKPLLKTATIATKFAAKSAPVDKMQATNSKKAQNPSSAALKNSKSKK